MTTHPVIWDPDTDGATPASPTLEQIMRKKRHDKLKDAVGHHDWFDKVVDAWRSAEEEQKR